MKYTPSMIRERLSNYQSRAQDTRERPPEDKLGTRAAPLEEAPWANTASLWGDIERAMQALPFNWEKIVFAELCLGGGRQELSTGWRNGMSRHNWREKVGDFWGISGGDVKRIVDESCQEMADFLNGARLNYEKEADTDSDHSRELPDLVDSPA